MARNTKALTLPEITEQIEQLQRQAAILREKHKRPVIDAIVEAMGYYGISQDELPAHGRGQAARGTRRRRGVRAGHTVRKGKRVAPKYRNPKTGETWSGRGRPARWIAEAEQRGQSRDRFLIK
jgi:DNA-binding protein H-NS